MTFKMSSRTMGCYRRKEVSAHLDKQKARIETRPSSSVASFCKVPLLMALLLSAFLPTSVTAQYSTCFEELVKADVNGDHILTESEHVVVCSRLSNNAVEWTAFTDLPQKLQSAFSFQAPAGVSSVDIYGASQSDASPNQIQNLQLFCNAIYTGLAEALGATTSQQQCYISMSIGDLNRDNWLSKDSEFPRFANQISGGSYGISVTFDMLPAPVQRLFENFVGGNGQIDVNGSKPGSTSSDEQLNFLTSLCQQTVVAVIAGEQLSPPVVSPPVYSPTQAPVGGSSFTFIQCTNSMAVSDLNRDNYLSQTEYLRFLNRLANNKYASYTYSTLPGALKENYQLLHDSSAGGISVMGSKPGQTAEDDEIAHLEKVCTSTDAVLQQGGGEPTTPATPAPVPSPATVAPDVTAPTIPQCTLKMAISDANRDSSLNSKEYLTFINRVANNEWENYEFGRLPVVLQNTFNQLASNGAIDITGSLPGQTPGTEQAAHLDKVCSATAIAVEEGLKATIPPTASPTVLATQGPGSVTVFNAFIVSNTVDITKATLASGKNREALKEGYANFVSTVVSQFLSERRHLRVSIRELIILGVLDGSPEIYDIKDSTCPGSVAAKDALCQTIFARFEAEYANEKNPDNIAKILGKITQNAIVDQSNDLQSFIEAAYAEIDLRVEGVSEEIFPPTQAPVNPPTGDTGEKPEQGNKDDGDGGGSGAGKIIGVLVVLLVVGGGAFWFYRRRKRGEGGCDCLGGSLNMPSIPSMPKMGKQGGTDDGSVEDELDDEEKPPHHSVTGFGGFDVGAEAPITPRSEKGGRGGLFGGSKKGSTRDDDEESAGFSVQEQSPAGSKSFTEEQARTPGGNVFGAFGLGKNKKGSTGNFDDSIVDNGAFKENGEADFENYAFDDPTVMQDQNQSARGDFFGPNGSPTPGKNNGLGGNVAWGATDSWGASGGGGDGASSAVSGSEGSRSANDNGDLDEGGDSHSDIGSHSGSGRYDDEEGDSESSESEGDGDEFTRETRGSGLSHRSGSRGSNGNIPENARHLDALVEKGDWDGVMAATGNFDTNFDEQASASEQQSQPFDEKSEDRSDSKSGSYDDEDPNDDGQASYEDESRLSLNSQQLRQRNEYRGQIEDLVRRTVPDELDNVSAMMDQFIGREAELVNTLETMLQRSSHQRARNAIHKSKALPQQSSRFTAGGTEGSAAIAAASTLGAPGGFEKGFDDEDQEGSYYSGNEEEDQEGSYYSGDEEEDQEGSYYSGDEEQEGSYYRGDEDQEGDSQYSGSEQSGSYSDEGSYDDEGSYSDEGSYDDEGTYDQD